jgi:hypothetical protein
MSARVTYIQFIDWTMHLGAEQACATASLLGVPGRVLAKWLAQLSPNGRA